MSLLSDLQKQSAAAVSKVKSLDALTLAVLGVIVVYIAIATPQNTPSFFRYSLVRFVLFAFVVVVLVTEGPVVGTMFALAMALPVIYSSIEPEGFMDNEGVSVSDSLGDNAEDDALANLLVGAEDEVQDTSDVRSLTSALNLPEPFAPSNRA
jgi:hypothetical protein